MKNEDKCFNNQVLGNDIQINEILDMPKNISGSGRGDEFFKNSLRDYSTDNGKFLIKFFLRCKCYSAKLY
jgi:hypothetical protein